MHRSWLLFSLLAVLCAAPILTAQVATGNITGRITDPTGAVVAGVDVTATNPAKGFTTRASSDEQGVYRLLYLEAATYTLTFRQTGLTTLERSGVVLRSNDTLSVDVQLSVGAIVEKVEVTAATPLLETATSTTGTVMSGMQLTTLPQTQRWTYFVMYLLPGVTSISGFHISGQRDRGLGFSMDGISGLEPIRGGIAADRIVSTTQNAIEEVKLVSTVLPAENGHSAGGLLSATYKSGTNQLHGEAEERYVHNSFLHRQFFQLPRRTTPFSYHTPSALISGPVYLPKLYNGRNRTFFLFGYIRKHAKEDQPAFSTVPTLEQLGGDFSFNGLGYPIHDPVSTAQDASGRWTRTPFPGNIVPRSRFDPVATKFLSFQPWNLANNEGGAGFIDRTGPHQNFGGFTKTRSYRTSWDVKIDHNFSDKNRMFARYSQVRNRAQNGNQIALNWELLDGNWVQQPSDQLNSVISDTHIFSPNLINELRLGANHRKQSRLPGGLNENWGQQLGVPGISPANFPSFFDSAGAAFYGASMPGGTYYQVTENYTIQENVTFIRSGHTFKTGYELLRTRGNTRAASLESGVYRFGGADFPFTPNTGNDFAAFLLGSVVRADFNTQLANWLPRWSSHALYFQDDWKVSPKLTLNLGLRWSYETPFQTKYGQQSQFDPTATDPVSGRLGAILHPKGALARSDRNNLQPRVGAAYKLNDRMVLRGGFGLTTIDLFTAGLDQNFEEFFTSVSLQRPSGDPRPAFFISQGPGPVQYRILPDGTSPFVGVNYSSRAATRYDPATRSPYTMNWNGTLQYQFAPTWLVELSYQGSAGVGLLNSWDTNAIPLDISRERAVLDQVFQNTQAYKPYTHFGAVNLWSNFGHSTYHSGTLKGEKRLSRGLTLTSFVTWAKAIDESDNDGAASGLTYYNRRLEKGRAGFDIARRSVTYATYELPLGRGRAWMNTGGWPDYLLGGWNLAWIQIFQSGQPVTFTVGGSPNRYLPGAARPNQLVPNDQVIVDNWRMGDRFDNNLKNPMWKINGFAYPAAYTAGGLGRNTIDGPGMIWSQVSLAKNVKVRERLNCDVRFDIQNPFKRPNFVNPVAVTNLTNPGTFGKPTATVGSWSGLGGSFLATLGVKLWF